LHDRFIDDWQEFFWHCFRRGKEARPKPGNRKHCFCNLGHIPTLEEFLGDGLGFYLHGCKPSPQGQYPLSIAGAFDDFSGNESVTPKESADSRLDLQKICAKGSRQWHMVWMRLLNPVASPGYNTGAWVPIV